MLAMPANMIRCQLTRQNDACVMKTATEENVDDKILWKRNEEIKFA